MYNANLPIDSYGDTMTDVSTIGPTELTDVIVGVVTPPTLLDLQGTHVM